MMTYREAKQRCEVNGCILRNTGFGDYEVFRKDWTSSQRKKRSYFTNDLDDAALTSAIMSMEPIH